MRLRGPGPTRRRLVFLCGAIPVVLTAAFAVARPAALGRLDDSVYDAMLRSAATRPPGSHVVIVDVDERSLAAIGQWPWRRDLLGDLIDRVREMGAAAIAIDIIFAEPDRYGGPDAATLVRGQGTPDEIMASRFRGGRVVLGYAMTFEADVGHGCVLHPANLAILHTGEETEETPYFRATGAICSLPILAEGAGASGFLNAVPDSDGILRRIPLVIELDGRIYPSLALSVVSAVTGARDLTLRVDTVNSSTLSIDNRTVPLDGRGNLLLRYRGEKKTFPYISAADILGGRVPPATLRDKIVFLGTTALGTREVVATPLDTLFVGVEVQATVTDNLLEQDFIGRSPLGYTLEAQATLLFGLAISLLVARFGIVSGIIGGAGFMATLSAGAVWLLSARGLFISPLCPTIGVVLALGVLTLTKFTVERGRAETAGREKKDAQRLMVQTLLSLTETRDKETGRHSRQTQQYARLLAEQLATHPDFRDYLTPERIDLLSSLAPIHDIGKVGIPDHILNKPGPLTPEELVEMRRHPALGRDVILKAQQQVGVRDDAILAMAKDIVYTHHERWDGTGYPQGLHGPEIPVAGRVMAIVDVYDAVTSRSLYKAPLSHDDTVKLIIGWRGTHFDPAVVEAFVTVAPALKRVLSEADPGSSPQV